MVVDVFEVLLARNAWEKRKLGETNSYFTDGNYGESYPKESELSDKENGVPFLRGSNLRNGELIEDNANYITKEKHAELTSGHLVEDDIVLAVRGSLGALGYVKDENIDWNINSQLAVIRTDKSELSGKFLVQFLLSWRGQKELLSRNTGTALKQLPIKQLKDVPVPIVNLDEQKEIGALFSSIDNLIAATQRRIDALEQAKKALLQRLFDQSWRFKGYSDPWEKRKWSQLVGISKNMVDPTTGKYDSLIHIGPGNIRSNSRELVDLKTVKDENLISGKFHFDKGDIIYGKINPQLAKYTIAPAEGLSSADTYVLKPKSGIERLFLYYTLGTNRFFKYTVSVSQRTGMPKINRDELNAYSLIIAPSLFEQKRIGLFLRKTDDLIAATQSRLSSLELLKKSLLQDLFI
ncbi:restriction endonuclease subunit S [Lacticaseibacillus paracasei]|uniref:restriction endonuclease subunit S n=1 Tax=Lacticaseibacillus paracasei TaxID=1597 RepID=UPI003B9AAD12